MGGTGKDMTAAPGGRDASLQRAVACATTLGRDHRLRERPWRCPGRGDRFCTAAAKQQQESRKGVAGRRFRQPRSWNPGKVEAGAPCLAGVEPLLEGEPRLQGTRRCVGTRLYLSGDGPRRAKRRRQECEAYRWPKLSRASKLVTGGICTKCESAGLGYWRGKPYSRTLACLAR